MALILQLGCLDGRISTYGKRVKWSATKVAIYELMPVLSILSLFLLDSFLLGFTCFTGSILLYTPFSHAHNGRHLISPRFVVLYQT